MSSGMAQPAPSGGKPITTLARADQINAIDTVVAIIDGQPQQIAREHLLASVVPLAGGVTLTAPIQTPDPTDPRHTATKAYVDGMGAVITTNVMGQMAPHIQAATQASSDARIAAQTAQNAALGASNAATTAVSAQKGTANGVAALDTNGNLLINGSPAVSVDPKTATLTILSQGPLVFAPGVLPEADPHNPGQAWSNGGYLMISQG